MAPAVGRSNQIAPIVERSVSNGSGQVPRIEVNGGSRIVLMQVQTIDDGDFARILHLVRKKTGLGARFGMERERDILPGTVQKHELRDILWEHLERVGRLRSEDDELAEFVIGAG